MSDIKEMKRIVESYMQRIWEKRDLKAIDELVEEKCVIHSLLGDYSGREAMRKVVEAWLKGFPDLSVKNKAVIGENDLVMVQWEAKGTHLGEFKKNSSTGRLISYSGVTIYRVRELKISEYWAYLDMQHLLAQLQE